MFFAPLLDLVLMNPQLIHLDFFFLFKEQTLYKILKQSAVYTQPCRPHPEVFTFPYWVLSQYFKNRKMISAPTASRAKMILRQQKPKHAFYSGTLYCSLSPPPQSSLCFAKAKKENPNTFSNTHSNKPCIPNVSASSAVGESAVSRYLPRCSCQDFSYQVHPGLFSSVLLS